VCPERTFTRIGPKSLKNLGKSRVGSICRLEMR